MDEVSGVTEFSIQKVPFKPISGAILYTINRSKTD